MVSPSTVSEIDDPRLDNLCAELAQRSAQLDGDQAWPGEQLRLCGEYGVFRWFLPTDWHGFGWDDEQTIRGYLRLSAACLTTTFVITQRTGACRRIVASENEQMKTELLADLASGESFATVGISHLTTSRRHLKRPVLRAAAGDEGYLLEGMTPWVTGAPFAQHLVVGATLDDGRQILAVVATNQRGVGIAPAQPLIGLSASQTGAVHFDDVRVPHSQLLAGPVEQVMASGVGARTGGLQTSTLALGLAHAAIGYLENESQNRPDFAETAQALARQAGDVESDLLQLARGHQVCSNDQLRTRANSLVLRSTQAALAAAKGAGYVAGHPVGRWCREALFFLVWSCPQPVVAANLCELASIES